MEKNNDYIELNRDNLFKAMQELDENEFKVYFWFLSKENNSTFVLSTSEISEKINVEENEVQAAISSLMEKGYITEDNNNNLIFYEIPLE